MGDLRPGVSMGEPPPSPCTGVCTLDADDRCLGCGRTLDEIAAWGSMDADRQRAVVAALSAAATPAVAGVRGKA